MSETTEKSMTVIFNANGGTPIPAPQTIGQGCKITEPAAVFKTDYLFDAWYKDAAFTEKWDFAADAVTGDAALYAKWTSNRFTVTLQCSKHGEYTGEGVIICLPRMKERKINPTCPVCQQEIDAENMRRDKEQAKWLEIQEWQSMNIDDKFYESTFDNFDAYNDELNRHLETCRAFAEKPDGKLVMLGKNGNGKTHLAVSVLKKLGGVIYTAFEIGVNLRKTINGYTKEHEVYDELCAVPLLVIDEVEKIKDTEAKQNWMSHVIGKRYNRMLPIIIIANCHTQKDCKEHKKPCPDCLEYHLEGDVISRIIEDGIIMKFGSGDYRRKIRETKFGKNSGE